MGLSLRPLGRKIVDIFSADTEEDQRKRTEAGQPRYYADQQRAMGNKRPATNPAAAVVGSAGRLVNTAGAGLREVSDTARMVTANLTNNPVAFRNVNEANQRFKQRMYQPDSGLFGAGTIFDNPQEFNTLGVQDITRRVGATTLGTAGEVLPVGRGLSFAKQGFRVLPKVAAQGAAIGAVGNVGDQYMLTGQVDPQQVAFSAATGGLFSVAPPVVAAGARQLPKAAAKGVTAVRTADEAMFATPQSRVGVGEQQILRDFSDALAGANKAQGRELSDLITSARQIGQKYGIDLTTGSAADRLERTNTILDTIGKGRQTVSQGGYAYIPGAGTKSVQPAVSARPSADKTVLPKVRQRGFVTSVKESPEASVETKQGTKGTYKVRSTDDLQSQAEQFAAGDRVKAKADLNKRLDVPEGRITDREVADTIALAKRLDDEGGFSEASDLYSKLAAHLTKQGQSVQAASLLARRTPEGLNYHARKTLDKAGVKLPPESQKKLKELIDKVKKTEPNTEERNRAVYDVTKFVNDQVPTSVGDKVINIWRAGLLTAPTTTLGNITGNLGEAIVRKGFVNPVATAADAAMSLVTGKRTQTLATPRSATKGFAEGAKTLPDYLKTGYDPRNLTKKYEQTRALNYGNGPLGKALGGYVNGVYRLMGTADAPFSVAAERETLSSLAGAEAINRGLKGKAKVDFIRDFVDNPTDKALSRARQEADFATFKNPTVLGKAATGLKRPLGPVGDFVVPFTQVPAAIATRLIQRTPVGIATEMVKQIRAVKAGQAFDQRAMAQAIGNGTFGIVAIGAGMTLAKDNLLTFGYPADAKERKLWEAEGKQPYSVRVGDRWYSLNYLQPFGMLLAIGGQAQRDMDDGNNPTEVTTKALATAGQAIQEQSFLKGINGVLTAISDPERGAQKWMESTTSSVVPNVVRSGARAADEVQRKPETVIEGVKSGIPGLRGQVPAKNDLFGEPLPAKDNFANQYLNPLRPSKARDTDGLIQEVRRLQDMELGKIPSQITKASFGRDVELSKDQVRELQATVGKGVKDAWTQVIGTPEYAALSDEDKSRTLDRISRDVLAAEKYHYSKENKIGKLKELTAKQKAIIDGKFDPSTYTTKKPNVKRRQATQRVSTGGRRRGSTKGRRSVGQRYKYAVSPSAGVPAASAKVSVKAPVRPKVKSKAKTVARAGSQPKVSLKKSRV